MKGVYAASGLTALFVLTSAFAGCNSGGGGGGAAGGGGESVVSRGVMKKGSVIVNGVTYGTGGAVIIHDDSPADETLLNDGMAVKVRGRQDAGAVTGTADKVKVDGEVTGTITAKGSNSITLVGVEAFTDYRTVYRNVAGFPELAPGMWVEVYGMRDSQGRLLATCIELLTRGHGPASDRLKGFVEAPFTAGAAGTLVFTMGTMTVVTAPGTLITPEGASIGIGDPVEVQGYLSGATFNAGRIDRQDIEDAEFELQENERYEGDGFVTGYSAATGEFTLNGESVRVTAATRYDGGVAADLLNNVRVEVEGRKTGGVLIADKVSFDDTVRIEANASVSGSANVLGKIIVTTGLTQLENLAGGVAGITAGQGLKIRGFANADGSITAMRIAGRENPVDANGITLQGVVESFNAASRSLVILGFAVNAASAAEVRLDDQPITLDRFFSLLAANRTIVKAQGGFSAATLTAVKVEIE